MVVLTAIAALVGLVVAVLTAIEKVKGLRKRPHPLAAGLADIAAAIRERGPDLHLRIDEPGDRGGKRGARP